MPKKTAAVAAAAVAALLASSGAQAAPVAGTVTEVSSFTVPKSPSGLFYYDAQDLLYVLCGTDTNKAHYLYAYTTDGTQRCFITIPESASMSRVDGFYIEGDKAYIVDSQGPIYADTKLGGSVYEMDWTNPCGCGADGACTESAVTWTPSVSAQITIDATDASIADGGGNDNDFRNSGIVVKDGFVYAVNGVHPNPDLTCCYPKSLVKVALADTTDTSAEAVQKWSFSESTLGRDVDMEGLTCGADGCADYIYIGDEYNYIYRLSLDTADAAAAIEMEWNVRSIAGDVPDDKGIESLTFANSTGYFYAGIQQTAVIHVLSLSTVEDLNPDSASSATASLALAGAALALLARP